MTFVDWLLERGDPDAVALETPTGDALTYGALRVELSARAQRYRDRARRAVAVDEPPESAARLVEVLAAMAADAVPVPLDPRAPPAARAVLRARCHTDDAHRFADETALVLCTSGSGGTPRAVCLGHAGLRHVVDAILDYLPVATHRRTGLLLPLSYSYALVGQAFVTLRSGGTVVCLEEQPFPTALHAALVARRVAGFSAVPSTLAALAEVAVRLPPNARAPLGYLASAGAPLPLAVADAVRAAFPAAAVFNQYGLTEASPRVTAVGHDEPAFAAGSVGRPLRGLGVAARRPNGDPCDVGEVGELFVSGPTLMLGYLGDAAATTAALGSQGLRTGDLGFVDPDGYVFITGRVDDLVKVAGERVSLAAVALALRGLEGVRDAFVVALPDLRTGARLVALVEVAPDGAPTLASKARAVLAPAHRPTRYLPVEGLPRRPNGKVDRVEARRLAETS